MANDSKQRYIITAAQYNAQVHDNFLTSLKQYAKYNDAKILVLPINDAGANTEELAEELSNLELVEKETRLNSNFQIGQFNIPPQNVYPLQGLYRFVQGDVSTVVASPKSHLEVIANSNIKLPKVLMTTGAVTRPKYRKDRKGTIAEKDHRYGALIVEICDKNNYHFRQIEAVPTTGHFIDFGLKYTGDARPQKATLEALVLGDWHVGDTDPLVREATFDMIRTLEPKRILLHDYFNGHSVNHHNDKKASVRSAEYDKNRSSLRKEIEACAKELQEFRKIAGPHTELVIVASNHNEFLDRYLDDPNRFGNDPINIEFACELFPHYKREENPLEVALHKVSKIPETVRFLKRDEDYKVQGWQLGSHGDQGSNGGRGSMSSKEAAYGKSITGHTHAPKKLRDTIVVGTSTHLKLGYNKGPSSWMNSHALLYDNGKVEMVNVIDGQWRME